MKKLFVVLCAVMLLGACTKTDIVDNPIIVDNNLLIGTWIFDTYNEKSLPTSKYSVSIYHTSSMDSYCLAIDGKWTELTSSYTLTNNMIKSGSGKEFKILYLSNSSLTLQDIATGDKWTARRPQSDIYKVIIGTWDNVRDPNRKDYWVAYNVDGSCNTKDKKGTYHT